MQFLPSVVWAEYQCRKNYTTAHVIIVIICAYEFICTMTFSSVAPWQSRGDLWSRYKWSTVCNTFTVYHNSTHKVFKLNFVFAHENIFCQCAHHHFCVISTYSDFTGTGKYKDYLSFTTFTPAFNLLQTTFLFWKGALCLSISCHSLTDISWSLLKKKNNYHCFF